MKSNQKENIISIAGIDYSLTSPSVAVYTGKSFYPNLIPFNEVKFLVVSDKKQKECNFPNITIIPHTNKDSFRYEIERFMENATLCVNFINFHKSNKIISKVLIEDYAMRAKGRVFAIGENTAILKYNLFQANLPYNTIPPTTIKKFATSKGNANKELMYNQFVNDTKITNLHSSILGDNKLDSPVTDIVDSYYILNYICTMN